MKKQTMLIPILASLIFLYPEKTQGQWQIVGRWPYGACNTVIADSDYVYIGNGGVVIIADNTNPKSPVEVSRLTTTGSVWKLFKSGDYLYVSNKMAGVRIIDVSDPFNPVEIGNFVKENWGYASGGENARDVYVYGNYAYLAYDGVCVVDVSDHSNPVEVAHLNTGWCWDIYIYSNYAYMTTSNGFVIFDITDPLNPVQLSTCLDLLYEARVYVSNGYAYVTNESDGFYILDVNDPLNPVIVAHLYTAPDWVWDVHGSGNYVYVVCHDTGLHVLDVTDPKNPIEVGKYHDVSADWEDIYVYGDYVYMTFSDGGFRVIDVSEPSKPECVCFYLTSGTAMDVFVSGNYAYEVGGDFHIIDISDPSNPREVGYIVSDNIYEKEMRSVYVRGNYAYVNGCDRGLPVLRIIDISDPFHPVQVGAYFSDEFVGGLARSLCVSGNYAYLPGYGSGLHIINISDPTNPVGTAFFNMWGPVDVCVSGNYAYLIFSEGLRILDVSNPSNPVQVGSIDLSGNCLSVAVSGVYVYVTTGDACCHIVDVSNPSNPIETANYTASLASPFNDINISGKYAYIASSSFGLFVLDISNPLTPVEVCNVNKIEARGVFVNKGFVYLVEEEFGIVIIEGQDTGVDAEDESVRLPDDILLYQNFPNPFNPTTMISYSIPKSENVQIKVYDLFGREVQTLLNKYQTPGTFELKFDGTLLPSGIYFYKIIYGDFSDTKKMLLLR